MIVEIKKLTSEYADDYVKFFDETPHDTNIDEHKCYCVCWASDDYKGKDFSTAQKRREYAYKYVKEGKIQGYLAFVDGEIVGWCNTNKRDRCLKCAAWSLFMKHVPVDDEKVKSIYCFVIKPSMKRKGIATQLLNRVCLDALEEGYDIIEAYPFKDTEHQSSDFGGYVKMYEKCGFKLYLDTNKGQVIRKYLK